jgi:ATP-dependent DNA helicase RecG
MGWEKSFTIIPEGGLLFIGIDKSGKVKGVTDVDKLQLKIKDRLKK